MANFVSLGYFNQLDDVPTGPLVMDAAGDLFGTTEFGGVYSKGSIFEIPYTSGSYGAISTLVSFNGTDGSEPGGLIMDSAGDLFGATTPDRQTNYACVYEIPLVAGQYAPTPTTLISSTTYSYTVAAVDSAGDLFGSSDVGSVDNGVYELQNVDGQFGSPTAPVSLTGKIVSSDPQAGIVFDAAGDIFGIKYGNIFEISCLNGVYQSPPNDYLVGSSTVQNDSSSLGIDRFGNLFFTAHGSSYSSTYVNEILDVNGTYSSTATTLATFTGNDGAGAFGTVIVDAAGDIFGTTNGGGANSLGSVYEVVDNNGTYASTPIDLFSFDGADGDSLLEGLIADPAGNLFGVTNNDGPTETSPGAGDGDGGVFEIANSGFVVAACYLVGTGICTPFGDVPIEKLTIGDTVITASGKHRPIRWIGRRSYAGAFAANNPDVQPVLFRAGSLGAGLPRRDLWVSSLHAMFVDGALIPARLLANGVSIVQADRIDQVEYVHVELDSHDLLLAEGAPSESFVDDYSRGVFHNAAEYRVLYPNAPRTPARYCAPRLEDGEALDAVQRRLAALVCPMASPGALRGYLDTVDFGTVTGWARDLDAPGERVALRVVVDGAVLGEVVADQDRSDLRAVLDGDGRHAFSFTIPGGLTVGMRHVVEVRRATDGQALRNSPMVVEPTPLALSTAPVPPTPLAGVLDHCDRSRIVGWAWQPGTDAPVALQVLDNGVPLVRILANLDRPDLRPAGMGNGRHGFDITVPGGLSPLTRHVLEFRRETDGAVLPGTPVVIEPAHSFDPALQGAVERAVVALDTDGEQDRVLSFLVAQTERLLERRASAASGAAERQALARFRRRWGPAADAMTATPRDAGRRALVIDSVLPAQSRDAGSEAVLSHIRAMQALGYTVSVTAADDLAGSDAALAQIGVACLGLPAYASVEDVLRRQAGCFDLVYLHRAPVASHYLQLARRHQPRARVVYSVADLHHLRMARQAAIEDRPELLAASRAMRVMECTAAWSADAVITHSTEEAAMLRDAVPGASVHVVPWAVPVFPAGSGKRRPRFADRAGVAFIGHGAHAPNADAARWLVETVMPLVWQADAAVECVLAGSALPERVRALAGPGVTVLGHVPNLRAVFDRVRLTVAPLRFGAGVKGKVLTSLAARTPCVMTPIAAEGLAMPPVLRDLVAEDAAGLASLIVRLHDDEALVRAAARAGAEMMRRTCSEDAVTAAMEGALGGPRRLLERKVG